MNHSKQWRFCLALVAMMFLGLNCGVVVDDGDFEVYLVKDGESSYHLQWTEPLKEERIVLVHLIQVRRWGFEDRNMQLVEPYDLVSFPAGSFRSNKFSGGSLGVWGGSLISVEIRPAEERFDIELPTKASRADSDANYESGSSVDILVGHPFQPYDVGDPSKLVFEDLETVKQRIREQEEKEKERERAEREKEPPPPARTVEVDPAPGAIVPSNQQFTLKFDQAVAEVSVNGQPATGSGTDWTVSLNLPEGAGVRLNVNWTNFDGSTSSTVIGPYTVKAPD